MCYTTSAGNTITEVRVRTYTQATGLGSSTVRFTDITDRSDTACRYYVLPTPVLLTPEMGAQLFVDANWSVAGTTLGFARTTFVLRATGTASTAVSKQFGDNVVILQEATGPDTSPEAAP